MAIRRKQIVVAVAIVLVAAAFFTWRGCRGSAAETAADKPTTAVAARTNMTQVVNSSGKVVSNLDVEVKCKAGGQIVKLPFDVSDIVKKGDLLAQLDPVDEDRKVKQAEVQLSASKARLASAKENLAIAEAALATDRRRAEAGLKAAESAEEDAAAKAGRLKELLAKKLSSQEEYDTAANAAVQAATALENARVKMEEMKTQERSLELKRQDVKLAETAVESDEIDLSIAQDRIRDTKVMAPMDGVVSERKVQVGQIIASATSNVGGGTAILTLSDLSRIFVLASVDESDIGRMQVGHPVRITVDAFPTRRFKGRIERIATRGVNASNVVTFEVKIEVLGDEKAILKPEMSANVEVTTDKRENVVAVPAAAVLRKPEGYAVEVVKDGESAEREVKIGLNDGGKVEVLSGLVEGEVVRLRDGDADSRWRGQKTDAGKSPFMPGPPRGGRH
jgi:HlyD family secretion protein